MLATFCLKQDLINLIRAEIAQQDKDNVNAEQQLIMML
jgi:hypothetical protein